MRTGVAVTRFESEIERVLAAFRNSSDTLTRKISYNFSIKIFSRRYLFRTRSSSPHRRSNHPIESCRVIINYDISHVTYRYPLAQLIKGSPESKRGGDIVHDRSLGEDDRCVHRKSSSRTIPGCLFETSRRKFTNRDT